MHQPIGDTDSGGFITCPPCLVAAQQGIIAHIVAGHMRIGKHLRQAHHVAQAEVKALPGDRMQRLRRITDQRQAMRHRTGGGG